MAVAHDATSEIEKTGAELSSSQTHTPVGIPRGIVVTIARANPGDTVADFFTSVTYGGVALDRVANVNDTGGEHAQACVYFLGFDIPSGPQTWTVNYSAAATHDVLAVCSSLTADADTEVVDVAVFGGDDANPQVTIDVLGNVSLTYLAVYSGLATVGSLTPNGNTTQIADYDLPDGTYVAVAGRQTTPSASNVAVGWTAAIDDVAMAAAAITEGELAAVEPQTVAPFIRVATTA